MSLTLSVRWNTSRLLVLSLRGVEVFWLTRIRTRLPFASEIYVDLDTGSIFRERHNNSRYG